MLKIVIFVFIVSIQVCASIQANSNGLIKLGMSNALTGPAHQLGGKLSTGALVYFEKLNLNGGINGQKVELISLDDGYEPSNTYDNTLHFINEEKVLALFGYVGTPTSHAILPIISKYNIPYLMPFTGADFLRTPVVKNIFNLRASYFEEAKAQIKYLVEIKGFKNIALVIQADQFGLAGQRSFTKILQQYGLKPIISERYKRNSIDIINVLSRLKSKPIDAVIFVGTYQPFSYLINLGYEEGFRPFFGSLSFVSSKDVFPKLKYPSKVIISEVMPNLEQCQWEVCYQFKKDMNDAGHLDLDRLQLEGYLNAHIFSLVAKQCGENLTRECLMKKFEIFDHQNSGLNISFSSSNHQGLNQVYLSFSDAVIPEKSP